MFLSRSFLLINPFEVNGFFPNIYNEDWIFMLPHIFRRSICSFGSIFQLPYKPFNEPNRVTFQEFGEIIAEGLYTLAKIKNYERRHDPRVWENEIIERRQTWIFLKDRLHKSKYRQIIDLALKSNTEITPVDCVTFIENWETDIATWNRFLMETET